MREAIRLNPSDDDGFKLRADLYVRSGWRDRAFADLSEVVRLNPKDPEAWRARGGVLLDKNELIRALDDLNEAVRLDPKNTEYLSTRADIHVQRREYAHALDDFSAVLRLGPQDVGALSGLALIEAACPLDVLRDGRHALKLAKEACDRVYRPNAKMLEALAAAYAETGQFAEAVRWQKRALEKLVIVGERAEAEARLKLYENGKPFRLPQRGEDASATPSVFKAGLQR
jgi:tetratricopeptide (TPR) repeat protein